FPGTEFHRLATENHWIEGGEYVPTDVQHHSILSYPGLSSREMEKLLFRYNLRFFLRPGFIRSQIRRFSSFSEFRKACKALKNKLTRSRK
ncbi:MAG: radical SAM protein, partial [Tannerella sp.]|nr:radical SAM protein [Tannerella sp.]